MFDHDSLSAGELSSATEHIEDRRHAKNCELAQRFVRHRRNMYVRIDETRQERSTMAVNDVSGSGRFGFGSV